MGDVASAWAAGIVATVAGVALVDAAIALRRRGKAEAGPPAFAAGAEIALHYQDSSAERSRDRSHPAFLLLPAVAASWNGRFDPADWLALGVAVLIAATMAPEIASIVRRLHVGPAIALHPHGLYLASRHGVDFLPWSAIEAVYTDPPDAGGYLADEAVATLHVEAKDGRSWRYSSRHFEDGAPVDFARLAATATWRTAPSGSMLRRP